MTDIPVIKCRHCDQELQRKVFKSGLEKASHYAKRKFCSLSCFSKDNDSRRKIGDSLKRAYALGSRESWNKGKHHSEETKKKMSASQTGKHHIPHTEETRNKLAESSKGNKSRWLGDDAKYHGKHRWIGIHWGKARMCQRLSCEGISKNYQWANLDGKYNRNDRLSWAMLCSSCHQRYDRGIIGLSLIGQPVLNNNINNHGKHIYF